MQKIIHRGKYTDEEAVDAADASNKFVERNVVNTATNTTTLERSAAGIIMQGHTKVAAGVIIGTLFDGKVESTTHTYTNMAVIENMLAAQVQGTDEYSGSLIRLFKLAATKASYWVLSVVDTAKAGKSVLTLKHDKIEVHNLPIKDIKNHADATLSGTPKLIELDIGGTPYYFKVYPTKT